MSLPSRRRSDIQGSRRVLGMGVTRDSLMRLVLSMENGRFTHIELTKYCRGLSLAQNPQNGERPGLLHHQVAEELCELRAVGDGRAFGDERRVVEKLHRVGKRRARKALQLRD